MIAWMLRDESLRQASGLLVLGPKAEKKFGRKNFMELYAVFSSPQSYTVQTTNTQPLGTLNQGFVDRLVDGVSCFLLGGRPWAVLRVQHDDRRVIVEPAPRGRQPTWGGFIPQFLGFHVCQKILQIVASTDTYGYLNPSSQTSLEEERQAKYGILDAERGGLEEIGNEIYWWTYAGGRINSTLRYALASIGPDWRIVTDNFLIRIKGDDLTQKDFDVAREKLHSPGFWENEDLWTAVSTSLPSYRLSKFQPLMPEWVEREIVANYLLDVSGTKGWLTKR